MIDLLLQPERALGVGLVDRAEQLYRQVRESDPRNSIAVVGLARVALERGDDRQALRLAREALAIDGENAAALRLAGRLEEVMAHRGEEPPPLEPPPLERSPATPPDAPEGPRRSLLSRIIRRR